MRFLCCIYYPRILIEGPISAILLTKIIYFKIGLKFIYGSVIMKIAPPEEDLQL